LVDIDDTDSVFFFGVVFRRFDASPTTLCDGDAAASLATGGGDADSERYCARFEKWLRLSPPWWREIGGIGTRIGDEMTF
jgi:hypothetical protein